MSPTVSSLRVLPLSAKPVVFHKAGWLCGLLCLGLFALAPQARAVRLKAAAAASAAPAGTPTVIAIGAVSPMPAGAVRIARLMDVPWLTLAPGSEVIVGPGAQVGPITIDARGSASRPITVRPSVEGARIAVSLGFDFQRASYVQVRGMKVEGSPWSAVMIREASDHITFADSVLRRSEIGVSIDGAGTGHQILDNLIEDSVTVGIAVDNTNASPDDRSRIAGNRVLRSGHHGMEIHGSHYLIEHNTTAWSGRAIGGTSGIHLFSRFEGEGTGDDNIIRYNFSHHNSDPWLSDGNGIQVDQWCDNNQVLYNVTWANDGAGIIIYDGRDNLLQSNTVKGNGLNSGGTHGDLGEIIVNSSGPQVNRTRGNRVFDNVVVATRPDVPGIFVDYTSEPNDNTVGPNLYQHRAGGKLLQRGTQTGQSSAQIDRVSGTTGNLAEAPHFVDEAAPIRHGLKLALTPTGPGRALPGQSDMLGVSAATGYSFFGAYYTAQPAP